MRNEAARDLLLNRSGPEDVRDNRSPRMSLAVPDATVFKALSADDSRVCLAREFQARDRFSDEPLSALADIADPAQFAFLQRPVRRVVELKVFPQRTARRQRCKATSFSFPDPDNDRGKCVSASRVESGSAV